jgi:hypothetical protein
MTTTAMTIIICPQSTFVTGTTLILKNCTPQEIAVKQMECKALR